MQPHQKQFIPFIHLLRGIAPLLVVWAHLGGAWYAGTYGSVWPVFRWIRRSITEPLHLFQDGAHLGVVVFFLISGYVISHVGRHESQLTFILKRAVRLLPTLFLAIFLMWLAWLASGWLDFPPPQGTNATSSIDFLTSASLMDFALEKPLSLGVTWTLYIEVMFYAIFCALLPLIRKSQLKSTLVMTAIAAAITMPVHFNEYAERQSIFTVYLPMFIMGRVLYLWERKELPSGVAIGLGCVHFALLLYICQITRPDYLLKAPEPVITYIAAPVIFYALMRANIQRVPVVISFFGRISYSLYLLHYPVGCLLMNLLYRAGISLDLVIVSGIAASIGAATAVTVFIEEPFQAFARARMKKMGLIHHDIGAGVGYLRRDVIEHVVVIDDAGRTGPASNANAGAAV